MPDKTRLELDIEGIEKVRTPASVKIVVFLLLAGLLIVCAYAFSLKQELSAKEQEIVKMKEKIELLGRINKLEHKTP